MTATLLLYRRAGCHLCDETRAILEALLAERYAAGQPIVEFREIDVAGDAELEARHGATIPVLELAGERLELAIRTGPIRQFLEQLLDGPGGASRAEAIR
ncbi:MAG: glutaredoxin [Chloroflexota bacterium]